MATAMQNMMIYVTDSQKRQLRKQAETRGTSVANEVRSAIDTHLSGVNSSELALLDAAARQAERDIEEMVERLDRTNKKLDAVLAERGRQPVARIRRHKGTA